MFKLSKDGYLPGVIYEEEFNDLAEDVRVVFASIIRGEKFRPELLGSWHKPIFISVSGDYHKITVDVEHDASWYATQADKILVITVIRAPLESLDEWSKREIERLRGGYIESELRTALKRHNIAIAPGAVPCPPEDYAFLREGGFENENR